MRICHISDSHGAKFHSRLIIPECDLLIHTGDIGGRTTTLELLEFLTWFRRQPAKVKIWIAGNHDLCMDSKWVDAATTQIDKDIRRQIHMQALAILKDFPDIVYLNDSGYTYSGYKIWGSPITPSFHREHWAFNADRGAEIRSYWKRIPTDTDILLTHGPAYGTLDLIPERFKEHALEDTNKGCKDLADELLHRLVNVKLHLFGHIHEGPTAIMTKRMSNTRFLTSSNGAVLSNSYNLVIPNPPIINI